MRCPNYLKPLFVTGYFTGVRVGELLAIEWDQVDWEQEFITLYSDETKSGHTRVVPIFDGDMRVWLDVVPRKCRRMLAVFHRDGTPIKEFRGAWKKACQLAGVPDLKFHDLRRTAVRNMRRMACLKSSACGSLDTDGFDGAALQHRGHRRHQVGQGVDATIHCK